MCSDFNVERFLPLNAEFVLTLNVKRFLPLNAEFVLTLNVERFLTLNAEFVLTLDEERFLTPNSKCALYLDTIRVSSNLLSQSTIPLSRTLSFTVLQSICVSLNPHVFLVSHHALCVL